jgi:uncharacterized membrane protein YeaQ/YmgE (transglycosylase-associated protein family)
MDGFGWIGSIIMGAIAGFLAGKFVYNSGQGFLTNLIVGIIGAVVGNGLFHFLGIGGTASGGLIYALIVSTIGAVIVLWIYNAVTGRRA